MITLYYRNFLKNCNYSCNYCPFSKNNLHEKSIEKDKEFLNQFIGFIEKSKENFRLFFAPKGEALIHDHYKQALIQLSFLDNVKEIVIQTNLSCTLDWIGEVKPNKLILWASYHPSEVSKIVFLNKIKKLLYFSVKFTVGVVGRKEHYEKIKEVKEELDNIYNNRPYMWINAYKDEEHYYNDEDIAFLKEIDPLFEMNLKNYKVKDLYCAAGETVFFVEWNGNLYKCWNDKSKLGNIYTKDFVFKIAEKKCKKDTCGCFIGYSHIKSLQLDKVYKSSLLGRIP